MTTHVSVLEVFANSTRTFKNSFYGLLITYIIGFIFAGSLTWAISAYYAIPWDFMHPEETIRLLPMLSPQAYRAIQILFVFCGFIFPIWQILIVKNNLFYSENRLWASLGHAFSKAILVVFGTFLLALFFVPLGYWVLTRYPEYGFYLPIVALCLTPFFINFYYGLILQEGTLPTVLRFSFGAAISGYIKTILAFVIFAIAEGLFTFLLFILFLVIQLITKFLFLPTFIIILTLLIIYIVLQGFTVVYFVEVCYAVSTEYESAQEKIRIKKENKRKAKDDIPQKYNKEGMLTLEEDKKSAKEEEKKENKTENKTDGKADAK